MHYSHSLSIYWKSKSSAHLCAAEDVGEGVAGVAAVADGRGVEAEAPQVHHHPVTHEDAQLRPLVQSQLSIVPINQSGLSITSHLSRTRNSPQTSAWLTRTRVPPCPLSCAPCLWIFSAFSEYLCYEWKLHSTAACDECWSYLDSLNRSTLISFCGDMWGEM